MRHPWDSQQFAEGARAAGRDAKLIAAAQSAALRIKRANPDLPVIFSLAHLAHLADSNLDMLTEVVARRVDPYRVFRVKKRASSMKVAAAPRRYRTICVPNPGLMRVQRWIAQNILNAVPPHPASYAFQPKKDLVGAAWRHAGCRWLVKMDVLNFFESISERQVYEVFRALGYGALIAFEMTRLCTRVPSQDFPPRSMGRIGREGLLPYHRIFPGHLPQGAPTSPMLANLAVRDLDARLDALAKNGGWTYTRYADDLAFSTPDVSSRGRALAIAALAERELRASRLEANRQKTTVTPPGARKVVLGVLVDRERPRLSKEFRNNIETHLYALNHPRIGPSEHRDRRGFSSVTGMRKHIAGLIAFAHQVDRAYARRLYAEFNRVDWSR
jgi:RNA-directed DNA polymerase